MGSETFNKYIREGTQRPVGAGNRPAHRQPGGVGDGVRCHLAGTGDHARRETHRPLVVSMSDLAASGGYRSPWPAPYIVAQPGTLTGSIGVVTGKIVTGGLYERLGANIEGVSQGKNAEMQSPKRPFTDSERAKVQKGMQDIYNRFVENAAARAPHAAGKAPRRRAGSRVDRPPGEAIGLVDELGGLDRAIAAAKQRAKIPASSDVEIVVYPPRRSVFELVSQGFRSDQSVLRAAGPAQRRTARHRHAHRAAHVQGRGATRTNAFADRALGNCRLQIADCRSTITSGQRNGSCSAA